TSSTTTKGSDSVPFPVTLRIVKSPRSSLKVIPSTVLGLAAALGGCSERSATASPKAANRKEKRQIKGRRAVPARSQASPAPGWLPPVFHVDLPPPRVALWQ